MRQKSDGSYAQRSTEEVLKAPRSAARSLMKTQRERNPGNFLTKAFWIWILDYLKTALRPRHEFLTYDAADKGTGIYTMPEECVVALASDWGTGTASAYRVRDKMQDHDPHITLHRHNQRWLRENVLATEDERPIILLSHHQWFSAFETEYMRLGKRIGADPRFHLWFWGHEHRLAGYGLHRAHDNGPRTRARCIGHGGMPIEGIHEPPEKDRNLVVYDRRRAGTVDGLDIGYCGFAVLTFEGEALKISYEDENGVVLLEERWVSEPGGPTGEIVSADDDSLTFVQPPQVLVA